MQTNIQKRHIDIAVIFGDNFRTSGMLTPKSYKFVMGC